MSWSRKDVCMKSTALFHCAPAVTVTDTCSYDFENVLETNDNHNFRSELYSEKNGSASQSR
jgi:hypothetical protein